MMNLFSSFNPMTHSTLSLNWSMLIIPTMLTINTYWNLTSSSIILIKMMIKMISTQFKPSMKKISQPDMIMPMSVLMMIFFYNIMSLLPNSFSVTSHIMMNLSMAAILWLATMIKKMFKVKKLLSNLTPSNTPPILIPFMVLIELVSLLIQPMTLSIRLTANITAGHIMMILISQMYYMSTTSALIMNLTMMLLELGVSLIQAYVFSLLIIMYSK